MYSYRRRSGERVTAEQPTQPPVVARRRSVSVTRHQFPVAEPNTPEASLALAGVESRSRVYLGKRRHYSRNTGE